MKQLHSFTIAYYTILGASTLFGVMFTLYQGSLFLFHAQHLGQLEKQHQLLMAQKQELQVKLAAQNSLVVLADSIDTSYQSITKPVIVKENTAVAVR